MEIVLEKTCARSDGFANIPNMLFFLMEPNSSDKFQQKEDI